jgi:cell shape-determining protein MreC
MNLGNNINMKRLGTFLFILILIVMIIFKDNLYFFITKTTLDNITPPSSYYASPLLDDYNDLLKTIKIQNPNKYQYIYTKIIARDLYNAQKELTILKGTNEGILKNVAVMDNFYLVGIVRKVSKENSVVELLKNSNTNISIKVNNSYGVLNCEKNKLVLNNMSNDDISLGDIVYTSGLTDVIGNLYIGKVTKINNGENPTKYEVESPIDENKLNFLVVVIK